MAGSTRTSTPYRLLHPAIRQALRVAFGCLGGLRVVGDEYVPRSGPLLVTPNHLSDCDPLALGAAIPRRCWYMAKQELFTMRLVGSVVAFCQGFAVRRGEADRAALRHAQDLLRAGEAVVIFPEGQLSETGRLQPLLSGVGMIALHTGAPILPVALRNTNKVVPYGQSVPRRSPAPIEVRFGPPVTLEHLLGVTDRRQRLVLAMEAIGGEISRLTGHPYTGTRTWAEAEAANGE